MSKARNPKKATNYTSDAESVDSILYWENDEEVPVSQTHSVDDILSLAYNGDQREVGDERVLDALPKTPSLPIRHTKSSIADYKRIRRPLKWTLSRKMTFYLAMQLRSTSWEINIVTDTRLVSATSWTNS